MNWFVCLNDARAWEDANGVHKMGWLREGDQIAPIEEYDGWLRFDDNVQGGADLEPMDGQYNERWVNREDVTLGEIGSDPDDETQPMPTEVTNEEAGAALATLVRFLRQLWS